MENITAVSEILFRGKCNEEDEARGEWIYGDLVHKLRGRSLMPIIRTIGCDGFDWYTEYYVDHATIGRWSGLTDKNGTKIFDGDILIARYEDMEPIELVVKYGPCGELLSDSTKIGYVGFYVNRKEYKNEHWPLRTDIIYWLNAYDCEVIGTVYDGQEAMKEATT